jgi:hypothetical protein
MLAALRAVKVAGVTPRISSLLDKQTASPAEPNI